MLDQVFSFNWRKPSKRLSTAVGGHEERVFTVWGFAC